MTAPHDNDSITPPLIPLLPMECFQPAFSRAASLAGAVISGAIAIAPAQAQEAGAGSPVVLDAVTVTGQHEGTYQAPVSVSSPKFTDSLLDTPRSITVIPEELIKDRGATSLEDVLRTTPGIMLGSGEGGTPLGDRPMVRGYEASTDFFIDGVRDFARGSHETFNLESVEVIKGPSSAFTGRGGTGGSINLVTKSPMLDDFLDLSAGFGNESQWRTTGDGNVQIGENSAFRLNFMKMGGDIPGRDGVKVDRFGIAPSLAFGLGTPTRVTLSYSRVENDDMPDQGIPFSNAKNPDRIRPPAVDRNTFLGRYNVDFRENHFDTATAKFEHDLTNDITVRNITRYGKTLNTYVMSRNTYSNCNGSAAGCSVTDPDSIFEREGRARWHQNEALINQTDIFGKVNLGGLEHSFAAGIEFSKEELFDRTMTGPTIGAGSRENVSLHNPTNHGIYDTSINYGSKLKYGDIKNRSLYVMDTIDFNDKISANIGLRYDNYRVSSERQNKAREDNLLNYQLGLIYKPAPNGTIYLAHSTSSNPVGENLGQAGGADGVAAGSNINDLKPERSRNWELGIKWDFLDEQLSLTSAIFQTSKTDARTQDPLTGDVVSDGDNQVRGLELGVSGAVTPKWSVWAGYSYMDPKIKSYRNANTDFDGNQIKFIAKHNASLWTSYKVLPNLTLGGGVSYVGMRYANDANSLEIPSYVRYDAMARYDVNRNLSFQFNVNNITDTEIWNASHVGLFAKVGEGRSYMLTANYRFD